MLTTTSSTQLPRTMSTQKMPLCSDVSSESSAPSTPRSDAVDVIIVAIHGDKAMDDIMHAADLFEAFRVYGVAVTYAINAMNPDLARLITVIKEGLEKQGQRVSAIFSPGNPEGAWIDETVKVLSDGKRWCLLKDALSANGYVSIQPATA